MHTRVRNTLKYALSFALAGLLPWLSFRGIDRAQFLDGLRQTDGKWKSSTFSSPLQRKVGMRGSCPPGRYSFSFGTTVRGAGLRVSAFS